MTPDDAYRQTLHGTIEGLRYWVPSIADVAHVAEGGGDGFWHIEVSPRTPGGCAFELLLRADQQHYDIVLDSETYEYLPVESLNLFLSLTQAIVEGRVIQRRWYSRRTGELVWKQSRILLPDGLIWQEGGEPPGGSERRDHHFLPYRRNLLGL